MPTTPAFDPGLEACDPGGMLRAALQSGRLPLAPHMLVIAWLLELPIALDPAQAAACLLAATTPAAHSEALRLHALLCEVSAWPRERLARQVRGRTRPL